MRARLISWAERLRAKAQSRWTPHRSLRAAMIACAVVALVLLVIVRATAPDPAAATALIGRPAPAFTLTAARDGTKLPALAHVGGPRAHPTLLIFFNTLCVHCQNEITIASQVAAAAPGGPLDVVYIDTPGESPQITGAYMTRIELDAPVLLDPGGAAAREYGAGYGPTLTLIDQRGVIRGAWVGVTEAKTLAAGILRALSA